MNPYIRLSLSTSQILKHSIQKWTFWIEMPLGTLEKLLCNF